MILSIEGISRENVDSILSELNSQLKLNVSYLIASVVAKSDVSETVRASTNFFLKIVVYALDSNIEPVSGEILEE